MSAVGGVCLCVCAFQSETIYETEWASGPVSQQPWLLAHGGWGEPGLQQRAPSWERPREQCGPVVTAQGARTHTQGWALVLTGGGGPWESAVSRGKLAHVGLCQLRKLNTGLLSPRCPVTRVTAVREHSPGNPRDEAFIGSKPCALSHHLRRLTWHWITAAPHTTLPTPPPRRCQEAERHLHDQTTLA